MAFKIGDVVRLKKDGPEKLPMIIEELVAGGAMCRSKCGLRHIWALLDEFELTYLAEPYADIKQAIREVLLSKEFLAEFAAAWLKTPILHESELNLIAADETRPYKSWNEIAKEAWQPVATAEVRSDATLEPITGSESEAYYLNKLKNGESK